jgi:regulator of protease activity HflC (stomatin/prohibitin superfamily)
MVNGEKFFIIFIILIVLLLIGGAMWGLPQYRVWSKGLSGQAQLREAEYTRQTAVEEARAVMESSKLLREAEVERAKGAAEAMEVIQQELTPEYLRYLAIQAQIKMADSPNHTTVYIPSGELGVPLIKQLEE